jgi:hypothetical protein
MKSMGYRTLKNSLKTSMKSMGYRSLKKGLTFGSD